MTSWAHLDPKGYDEKIETQLRDLGFIDSSWHNDISPSFHHEERRLRLWIDYIDEDDQETEDEFRFVLHRYSVTDDQFECTLGGCAEWEPMHAAIVALLALKSEEVG